MKKLLLLLVMMISMVTNIFAVEVEIDGLWYEVVSKTKEAKVIQYKNNNKYSGNIVIPNSVEYSGSTFSVTNIGESAFNNCNGLASITIPGSVTSIGKQAFQFCSKIKSITLPNSVKSLEALAFAQCTGLKSIEIPNSVTSIGNRAFADCSNLLSITIPNSVININPGLFEDCSGLTSVIIPYGVTSIGKEAFSGCKSLLSVTIPNSVTTIGEYAFQSCSSLSSVEISNKLNSIELATFFGCSSLTSIVIPKSVTSIGESAFSSCSGLTSITIPNSVTGIWKAAFKNCSALSTVTIGNGIKSISMNAFDGCSDLNDVYCYTENVPTTHSSVFSNALIEYATLHVPTVSVNSYKTADPWKNFKEIIGIPDKVIATNQVNENYWATYYSSVSNFIADANTTVYTATKSGNTLNLVEISDRIIKAGDGVILKSTSPTSSLTLTSTAATNSYYANNILEGADQETAQKNGTTYYVLSYENSKLGFYKYSGTLGANKAYLSITDSNAPEYFDFGNWNTGVNTVNKKKEVSNDKIYNLNGQRIKLPSKGLYIVNGRKTIK